MVSTYFEVYYNKNIFKDAFGHDVHYYYYRGALYHKDSRCYNTIILLYIMLYIVVYIVYILLSYESQRCHQVLRLPTIKQHWRNSFRHVQRSYCCTTDVFIPLIGRMYCCMCNTACWKGANVPSTYFEVYAPHAMLEGATYCLHVLTSACIRICMY